MGIGWVTAPFFLPVFLRRGASFMSLDASLTALYLDRANKDTNEKTKDTSMDHTYEVSQPHAKSQIVCREYGRYSIQFKSPGALQCARSCHVFPAFHMGRDGSPAAGPSPGRPSCALVLSGSFPPHLVHLCITSYYCGTKYLLTHYLLPTEISTSTFTDGIYIRSSGRMDSAAQP